MKLEDLSPEMQEKAEACETVEELAQLAESEGVELSDEDLDAIAGGIKNIQVRRLRPRLLRKQPKPRLKPQPEPSPEPELPAVDDFSDSE